MARNSTAVLSIIKPQEDDVVATAMAFLFREFKEKLSPKFLFHDFNHLEEIVQEAKYIAEGCKLDPELVEKAVLASCFVTSGYTRYGEDGWSLSESSVRVASEFLNWFNYPSDDSALVINCVRVAALPSQEQKPQGIFEEIVCDSVVAFYGKKKFGKKSKQMRAEVEALGGEFKSEIAWKEHLLGLLTSSHYNTEFAEREYHEQKAKNIKSLNESVRESMSFAPETEGKAELSKAVETLFRTQSRNESNLVGLADKKAGVMIHMNSIVLSIGISFILGRYGSDTNRLFLIPASILVVTNLLTIWLAVLAVRPSVDKKTKVTREDVLKRHGYITSQVIFADISFEDFKLGMYSLMQDEAYIYESMMQSLYVNGKVLQTKFRRIRASYQIFLYGISATVVAFAIIMLISKPA